MIKHHKIDDGVLRIVAVVSIGLWWSLGSQDECFLGIVKTGLGQFITWSPDFSLKVVCDPQWRLIVKICPIVNRNCVQAVNYGDQSEDSIVVTWPVLTNQRPVWTYGHDLDLAIVPTLGLSAWLARENGKIFDQSEDSLRVLTNQRTCWPSQSQINERLPPQHLDNDSLNWRQKIVLMLYWAPGAKPTWQFSWGQNEQNIGF